LTAISPGGETGEQFVPALSHTQMADPPEREDWNTTRLPSRENLGEYSIRVEANTFAEGPVGWPLLSNSSASKCDSRDHLANAIRFPWRDTVGKKALPPANERSRGGDFPELGTRQSSIESSPSPAAKTRSRLSAVQQTAIIVLGKEISVAVPTGSRDRESPSTINLFWRARFLKNAIA